MTIHLPEELERFVHNAVLAGRYAREDDVISDALFRLKRTMPEDSVMPGKSAKRTKPAQQRKKPLTKDEFHQHLLEIGLMSQLPDPAQDIDDDDPEDEPIVIEGEPLSETIIRERR